MLHQRMLALLSAYLAIPMLVAPACHLPQEAQVRVDECRAAWRKCKVDSKSDEELSKCAQLVDAKCLGSPAPSAVPSAVSSVAASAEASP